MTRNVAPADREALTDQELERESGSELPNREAMSLLDPGAFGRPLPLDGSMTGIPQTPPLPTDGLPQPLPPVPGPTPA